MRKMVAWSLAIAAVSSLSLWAADWPSTGGNPQRDGWSQGDTIFSKASIGKVKQVWKYKYDNKAVGVNAMTSPIVLSRLIGYHGFEELVMATGSGGAAYALDADLGRAYFKTPFPPLDKATAPTSTLCPGGQTASMVMWGQSATSRFGGFGGPNPVARLAAYYTVSSDGYIRTMRAQDGQAEMIPPAKMLPANSNVTGLNMAGSTVYAATINGCGGTGNGLYAGTFTPPVFPPVPDQPMVSPSKWEFTSFMTNGSGFAGSGGVASSTKNDVMFGTLPDGKGDIAGTYNDTTLALDAKTLTVKDWFTPSSNAPAVKAGMPMVGVTPAVFAEGGKDYVIAGGRDGRIYVLDSTALGGSDHHTPLFASEPLIAAPTAGDGMGIYGTFATAVESGQRWVFAAVHGPVTMKFPGANGAAASGGIVAFKLSMTDGRPSLTPAWSSKAMISPMAPAVANGLLFALSSGMPTRVAKENGKTYTASEIEKMSKPAVLSILDTATGEELFTSGTEATSFASSGIAVANGHVYFTTHDNMMYAYGVPEER
jgi:outer membrane protein assembly factor BamB